MRCKSLDILERADNIEGHLAALTLNEGLVLAIRRVLGLEHVDDCRKAFDGGEHRVCHGTASLCNDIEKRRTILLGLPEDIVEMQRKKRGGQWMHQARN